MRSRSGRHTGLPALGLDLSSQPCTQIRPGLARSSGRRPVGSAPRNLLSFDARSGRRFYHGTLFVSFVPFCSILFLHWTSPDQATTHQTRAASREPPLRSRPPLKPALSPIVQIVKEPKTQRTTDYRPLTIACFFLRLRSRRDPPPPSRFPLPTASLSRIPGRRSCPASHIAPVTA
jgi:hypothetical protein